MRDRFIDIEANREDEEPMDLFGSALSVAIGALGIIGLLVIGLTLWMTRA